MSANHESKLHVVYKLLFRDTVVGLPLVFRTRKAARDYAKKKNAAASEFHYHVGGAKWGPDA